MRVSGFGQVCLRHHDVGLRPTELLAGREKKPLVPRVKSGRWGERNLPEDDVFNALYRGVRGTQPLLSAKYQFEVAKLPISLRRFWNALSEI